jgi:hypothetical protein
MRIVERAFGWMIYFAVVVGICAAPTAQTSDATSAPCNWSLSALPCVMNATGGRLDVFCVTYGMCRGTYWFEKTQCQAEYTGFGGAVSAHFWGTGADETALTSWECGVDNWSRAPSLATVRKLRIGMTMQEVEQALEGAYKAVPSTWHRRLYVHRLREMR